MSPDPAPRSAAIPLATVHALAWLAVACGVGLLLSLLLLFPELNAVLGPLTYGRWMPLHLDLALYGWLALPLVALLFRAYQPAARAGTWAVQVWSGTLVAGAASWLLGQTTGKAFLDWQGIARFAFLANLVFLAVVLAAGLIRRKEERLWGLWALWGGLLGVAILMASATSVRTYPPINPATGGPTGASLLGSTLAVIAIFLATPLMVPVPPLPGPLPRAGGEGVRKTGQGVFIAFGAHSAFFAFVGLGEHTHREPLQIAAVASLLAWAWLLPRWLGGFDWPAGSRPWLVAFLAWGGALLASAVPMFLPGLLDRIKFTNALVGHAHLAMAGMATSFAALVLTVLNRETALARVLADRAAFVLWHAGNAAHVAALAGAGALEAVDPGIAFRGDRSITVLYALRAAAGTAMLLAAVRWTGRAVRRSTL